MKEQERYLDLLIQKLASLPRMLDGVAYRGSLHTTSASREAKAWEWTLKQ